MALLDPTTMPLCMALTLAVLAGTPARAQVPASADGDRVRFELRGHVAPRCALSGVSPILDIGALIENPAAELRIPLKVDCNTPFGFAISADAGAIRTAARRQASGHAGEIPFKARLSILTDGGGTLSLDCSGEALGPAGAGCRGHSGDDIAIAKDGVLAVRWTRPSRPLAAGRYEAGLRIHLDMGN